jgi:hypothetical protein
VLGPIHGRIGGSDEVFAVRRVPAEHSAADAPAYDDYFAPESMRL